MEDGLKSTKLNGWRSTFAGFRSSSVGRAEDVSTPLQASWTQASVGFSSLLFVTFGSKSQCDPGAPSHTPNAWVAGRDIVGKQSYLERFHSFRNRRGLQLKPPNLSSVRETDIQFPPSLLMRSTYRCSARPRVRYVLTH